MRDTALPLLRFDAFELDEANARLTSGGVPIALPPKAFAVLCTLARHAGQLIRKDDLLDAVWGHQHISESVLKTTISQVRAALSDGAGKPRYIETASRRGYRFIAAVRPADSIESVPAPVAAPTLREAPAPAFIGRQEALRRLLDQWNRCCAGRTQIGWVAGDAGVGKTTLIDAFARGLGPAVIAHGQCVEQFGAGEPYLPVLEALGSLCRRFPDLTASMRAIAPTWLLQMPWLIGEAERQSLHRELAGISQDRMVRELAELLERFTQKQPLLLVSEDLHWSDQATLRLMHHFARRRGAMRLFWLGSFRLTQAIAEGHAVQALRQELRLHHLCEEIVLDPFSASEVGQYLQQRIPAAAFPDSFVQRLHDRTDGLPLFLASLIDSLVQDVGESGEARSDYLEAQWKVPDNLVGSIEVQISKLPPETQRLLEAASVCGVEFRASSLCDVMGQDATTIAASCDELVRRQFWLRDIAVADLPDGSLDARYSFRHALYRHVFYHRTAPSQRVQLHRRAAASMQARRGPGYLVKAAELAAQFEAGLQYALAVKYYAEAAESALRHFAPQEAADVTAHALTLIPKCNVPEDERLELELAIVSYRGIALSQLQGLASEEAVSTFQRARQLCDLLPETSGRALLLNGLGWGYYTRGQYSEARALAQRVHDLSRRHDDPVLLVCACSLIGVTLCIQGELEEALKWLQLGLETCDSLGDRVNHPAFMIEPGVMLRVNMSVPLMHLGRVDRSHQYMKDALERAERIRQPMARMLAFWCAAMLEMRWRRPEQVALYAEGVNRIAMEAGLAHGAGPRRWLRGYVEAHRGSPREGHRLIVEGYRINERLGIYSGCAEVLGYAAEALMLAKDWPAAEQALAEARALAERLNEKLLLPYFDMLEADMHAALGNETAARAACEVAFRHAQAVHSPWGQVRALVGMCELSLAKPADFAALAQAFAHFTEGADLWLAIRARKLLGSHRASGVTLQGS